MPVREVNHGHLVVENRFRIFAAIDLRILEKFKMKPFRTGSSSGYCYPACLQIGSSNNAWERSKPQVSFGTVK